MKGVKRVLLAILSMCFLFGPVSGALAEPVISNGSFETGDYTGWEIDEGNLAGQVDGTWGIAKNGQTIDGTVEIHDYYDGADVKPKSPGLPITYQAAEGEYLAIHLQNTSLVHSLWQDISLPANALALGWSMFYTNHSKEFSSTQYLAVHIRDLNDNILETLFATDGSSPLAIPMSDFVFDISGYAGSTVRIDVDLTVIDNYFDAAFDNFFVELAPEDDPSPQLAPPGWSRVKGKKLSWAEKKASNTPKGFEKGKKTGWDK